MQELDPNLRGQMVAQVPPAAEDTDGGTDLRAVIDWLAAQILGKGAAAQAQSELGGRAAQLEAQERAAMGE